jgi:multidrug efflux pump subunit AcrB
LFAKVAFMRIVPLAWSTSLLTRASLLRHRLITLCVFFATLALSVYLYVAIPKGFFPQQDIGLITGISEAAQDVSPAEMARLQEALGDVVMRDPDVEHVAMFIGGSGNSPNNGRMFITLKPLSQRTATADRIIARLRGQLDKVEGAKLFLQAAQDVRVGGRSSRTQFQYTLQAADIAELNEWAPKMLDKLKGLPELRDVATDQQTEGTTLTLTIDRDQASRYGLTAQMIDDTLYDAFGQRQIAQYFTQLSSYYVIMEVLPASGRSVYPRQNLLTVADDRWPGAPIGLRQMDDGAEPKLICQLPLRRVILPSLFSRSRGSPPASQKPTCQPSFSTPTLPVLV